MPDASGDESETFMSASDFILGHNHQDGDTTAELTTSLSETTSGGLAPDTFNEDELDGERTSLPRSTQMPDADADADAEPQLASRSASFTWLFHGESSPLKDFVGDNARGPRSSGGHEGCGFPTVHPSGQLDPKADGHNIDSQGYGTTFVNPEGEDGGLIALNSQHGSGTASSHPVNTETRDDMSDQLFDNNFGRTLIQIENPFQQGEVIELVTSNSNSLTVSEIRELENLAVPGDHYPQAVSKFVKRLFETLKFLRFECESFKTAWYDLHTKEEESELRRHSHAETLLMSIVNELTLRNKHLENEHEKLSEQLNSHEALVRKSKEQEDHIRDLENALQTKEDAVQGIFKLGMSVSPDVNNETDPNLVLQIIQNQLERSNRESTAHDTPGDLVKFESSTKSDAFNVSIASHAFTEPRRISVDDKALSRFGGLSPESPSPAQDLTTNPPSASMQHVPNHELVSQQSAYLLAEADVCGSQSSNVERNGEVLREEPCNGEALDDANQSMIGVVQQWCQCVLQKMQSCKSMSAKAQNLVCSVERKLQSVSSDNCENNVSRSAEEASVETNGAGHMQQKQRSTLRTLGPIEASLLQEITTLEHLCITLNANFTELVDELEKSPDIVFSSGLSNVFDDSGHDLPQSFQSLRASSGAQERALTAQQSLMHENSFMLCVSDIIGSHDIGGTVKPETIMERIAILVEDLKNKTLLVTELELENSRLKELPPAVDTDSRQRSEMQSKASSPSPVQDARPSENPTSAEELSGKLADANPSSTPLQKGDNSSRASAFLRRLSRIFTSQSENDEQAMKLLDDRIRGLAADRNDLLSLNSDIQSQNLALKDQLQSLQACFEAEISSLSTELKKVEKDRDAAVNSLERNKLRHIDGSVGEDDYCRSTIWDSRRTTFFGSESSEMSLQKMDDYRLSLSFSPTRGHIREPSWSAPLFAQAVKSLNDLIHDKEELEKICSNLRATFHKVLESGLTDSSRTSSKSNIIQDYENLLNSLMSVVRAQFRKFDELQELTGLHGVQATSNNLGRDSATLPRENSDTENVAMASNLPADSADPTVSCIVKDDVVVAKSYERAAVSHGCGILVGDAPGQSSVTMKQSIPDLIEMAQKYDSELRTNRSLQKKVVIVQQQLESTETALERTKTDLEQARTELGRTKTSFEEREALIKEHQDYCGRISSTLMVEPTWMAVATRVYALEFVRTKQDAEILSQRKSNSQLTNRLKVALSEVNFLVSCVHMQKRDFGINIFKKFEKISPYIRFRTYLLSTIAVVRLMKMLQSQPSTMAKQSQPSTMAKQSQPSTMAKQSQPSTMAKQSQHQDTLSGISIELSKATKLKLSELVHSCKNDVDLTSAGLAVSTAQSLKIRLERREEMFKQVLESFAVSGPLSCISCKNSSLGSTSHDPKFVLSDEVVNFWKNSSEKHKKAQAEIIVLKDLLEKETRNRHEFEDKLVARLRKYKDRCVKLKAAMENREYVYKQAMLHLKKMADAAISKGRADEISETLDLLSRADRALPTGGVSKPAQTENSSSYVARARKGICVLEKEIAEAIDRSKDLGENDSRVAKEHGIIRAAEVSISRLQGITEKGGQGS